MPLYIRKRDPEHPFWEWAAVEGNETMVGLLALVRGQERSVVSLEEARREISRLRELYGDSDLPAEIVDYDGNVVDVEESG